MIKALKCLYILLGACCVAYYFLLWHASRLGLSLSWMWPLLGVFLIILGLKCDDPAIPRWLHWGVRIALCLVVVGVVALEGLVISGMSATPPRDLDALIVLGARVDPDGPSPALTRRLNAVMACLEDHPRALIVATGGQGSDEPMSEAECIRRELVARGVDPNRILSEDRSTSTVENLKNAMAILGNPDLRVGIITNNYHVWRAVHLAEKVGYTRAYGIAAQYTGHTKFHYMIREAICIVVDWLRGDL